MSAAGTPLELAHQYGLTQLSYSPTEVFAILGVGKDLGWRILHQGQLKASRIGRQNVRVLATDLAAFIASNRLVPQPSLPRTKKKRGRPPGPRLKTKADAAQ
jgi:hypothetical protein